MISLFSSKDGGRREKDENGGEWQLRKMRVGEKKKMED